MHNGKIRPGPTLEVVNKNQLHTNEVGRPREAFTNPVFSEWLIPQSQVSSAVLTRIVPPPPPHHRFFSRSALREVQYCTFL